MKPDARVHIYISGVVQGVFFRAHTREQAKRLGLVGWVRNLPDRRVEVVAEGNRQNLERLIEWCHKGPDLAVVEEVYVEWQEPSQEFDDFRVRY